MKSKSTLRFDFDFRNLLSRLIEKRISIFRDVNYEAGYIGDYHTHTHTYIYTNTKRKNHVPFNPIHQKTSNMSGGIRVTITRTTRTWIRRPSREQDLEGAYENNIAINHNHNHSSTTTSPSATTNDGFSDFGPGHVLLMCLLLAVMVSGSVVVLSGIGAATTAAWNHCWTALVRAVGAATTVS